MATRINLLEWLRTKFNTKEEISDLLDDKLDVEHNSDNNAHSSILSTVAKSGNYNDLSNRPTIDNGLSTSSTNAVQNNVVTNALNDKSNTNHNHDDRYYTESEVDTFLNGKSSINHTHGGDDVLFGSEGSQTTLTSKLTTIESDISALQTADWDIRIVQTLPAEGEAGALYFVPNEDTGDNQYDEYIWEATSERFEKLGQRNIDLSDYVQKDDVAISLSNAGILSISVE